uniref:Uncharacterized protein n=1 Tax=Micrurus paraensis TaxID=1970185 RepID=A0A2D4KRL9_9SAUR
MELVTPNVIPCLQNGDVLPNFLSKRIKMLKRYSWIVSSCPFLEQLILYFGMIIAGKMCVKQQFKVAIGTTVSCKERLKSSFLLCVAILPDQNSTEMGFLFFVEW